VCGPSNRSSSVLQASHVRRSLLAWRHFYPSSHSSSAYSRLFLCGRLPNPHSRSFLHLLLLRPFFLNPLRRFLLLHQLSNLPRILLLLLLLLPSCFFLSLHSSYHSLPVCSSMVVSYRHISLPTFFLHCLLCQPVLLIEPSILLLLLFVL